MVTLINLSKGTTISNIIDSVHILRLILSKLNGKYILLDEDGTEISNLDNIVDGNDKLWTLIEFNRQSDKFNLSTDCISNNSNNAIKFRKKNDTLTTSTTNITASTINIKTTTTNNNNKNIRTSKNNPTTTTTTTATATTTTIPNNPNINTIINTDEKKIEIPLLKPIMSPLLISNYEKIDITILTTNLGWLNALEIDFNYLLKLNSDFVDLNKDILFGVKNNLLYWSKSQLNKLSFLIKDNHTYFINLKNSLLVKSSDISNSDNNIDFLDFYYSFLDKLYLYSNTDKHGRTSLKSLLNLSDLKNVQSNCNNLNNILIDQFTSINSSFNDMMDFFNLLESSIQDFVSRNENIDTISRKPLPDQDIETFNNNIQLIKQDSREMLENSVINDDKIISWKDSTIKDLYENSIKLYETTQYLNMSSLHLVNSLKSIMNLFYQFDTSLSILKRKILIDINSNLKKLHDKQLTLVTVEDLPIVYAIYMIEKFKRLLWLKEFWKQKLIDEEHSSHLVSKEFQRRKKWLNSFKSLTSQFFDSEFDENIDLKKITNLDINAKSLDELNNECDSLYQYIDNYISTFAKLTNNQDVIIVLQKKFTQAQLVKEVFPSGNGTGILTTDYSDKETDLIESYKLRIERLESQLHESIYLTTTNWPQTIFDTSVDLNNEDLFNLKNSLDLKNEWKFNYLRLNLLNLQNEEIELNKKIISLRESLQDKEKNLTSQNSKLVDLQLEKDAYKEMLNNLNKEITRLTNNATTLRQKLNEQELQFSNDMKAILIQYNEKPTISDQNDSTIHNNLISNANTDTEGKDKIIQEQKEELDKLREQIVELAKENTEIKEQHSEEKKKLLEKNKNLQDQLKKQEEELEQDKLQLQADKDKIGQEKIQLQAEKEQIEAKCQSLINKQETTASPDKLSDKIHQLTEELFTIFKINIYLLENIGLMLSFNENMNDGIEIKRVKGLKKHINQSRLQDGSIFTQLDTSTTSYEFIQSEIFHNLKESSTTDLNSHGDNFLETMKKIFDSKLYENAVVRRFNDIESLAKKLTKENKSKRVLIDKYENEKITIKDLKIGDLVLFLPTSDNIVLQRKKVTSNENSLTSSFSSIDLSTPPSTTNVSMPYNSIIKNTINAEKNVSNEKCDDDGDKFGYKYMPIWAAFTAFDNETRYFLNINENDNKRLLEKKDWFIGRILSLKQFSVGDSKSNPYCLPNGTRWFEVTAELMNIED